MPSVTQKGCPFSLLTCRQLILCQCCFPGAEKEACKNIWKWREACKQRTRGVGEFSNKIWNLLGKLESKDACICRNRCFTKVIWKYLLWSQHRGTGRNVDTDKRRCLQQWVVLTHLPLHACLSTCESLSWTIPTYSTWQNTKPEKNLLRGEQLQTTCRGLTCWGSEPVQQSKMTA